MTTVDQPIRILLFGPLPIAGDHVGGAKAAFVQMVSDIEDLDWVETDVVNLSRALKSAGRIRRVYLNLQGLFKTVVNTLLRGHASDVWALNVSPVGSFTLLPIMATLATLYRKPLIVRMFGGSFHDDYSSLNKLQRSLYKQAFRSCNLVTMETRKLMNDLSDFQNLQWLPNTRNNQLPLIVKSDCKKFIFLSQIRKEKGVREIIRAMSLVASDVSVDFYGSIFDRELVGSIEQTPGLAYCGELPPEQVYQALSQYDALLLPTYWQGEGLPGVIVEAFQSGIPVIASDWRQIPELVEHGYNGLLVKSEDDKSLAEAIDALAGSSEFYAQLCANAGTSGEQYRSKPWNEKFCAWCARAQY